MATYSRDAGRVPPAAWASWLNLILGLWMIISPFVVRYSISPAATWNGVVLGILVAIAGVVAAQSFSAAASWWNVAFGVWLIISPWLLRFADVRGAMTNNVICGAAVLILGLIAALTRASTVNRPLGTSPGV
ncbi:MAG TPA: SPW repeat protein [Gemmataceae bacterium]|jgi:uncharacterized membrane protein HdeD (DUF308 family)